MTGAVERLSETGLLIDDALRQVREAARLDEDPVLPPPLSIAPRRDVILISRDALFERAMPMPAVHHSATPTTKLPKTKKKRRGKRWPLFLCAFVASTFAGAAFLASPLGARPEVRRAVDASRAELSKATHAVTGLVALAHAPR